MNESTYIPKGKLALYVEFIWSSRGHHPQSRKERVLPTGSSQLIINLGNTGFRHFKDADQRRPLEYGHTIVTGIQSTYIFLDSRTRTSTMGAVLKPGAIQALLGLPADEFRDRVISLGDLIDEDMAALRERLIAASDLAERFGILESFLTHLLDKTYQPDPAVITTLRYLNQTSGRSTISEIADHIGYSRRRLSELFRQTAGTTPKDFVRIRRFQQSLQLIRKSANPRWPQLALSCGYYDQPHFNRDFKALSGLTPTQYHRNQSAERNHLLA